MNPYLTEDNQPSETLQYTLDYYGISLDEFKAMTDEQVAVIVMRFSDVLNDGRIQKSGKAIRHNSGGNTFGGDNIKPPMADIGYPDSGSFSRYFNIDAWYNKTFPFFITPKASKSEKNKGLTEIQEPSHRPSGVAYNEHSSVHWEKKKGNFHPTCKPLKLMCYLITLGSRQNDVILDPFMGSGTTGVACKMTSREFIGMEISEDYFKIATKRCSQMVMEF